MTIKFTKRCYITLQIRSPGRLDIKIQEQAVPTCWKTSLHRRRLSWLNRKVWLVLRVKKDLSKKGQENQDYKDAVRLFRVKIRKVKAQTEFNLATAIKTKILCHFSQQSGEGCGESSNLYWMWGEKVAKFEEGCLKYFVPPFPLALTTEISCSPCTQHPDLEDMGGKQIEGPTVQGKMVCT